MAMRADSKGKIKPESKRQRTGSRFQEIEKGTCVGLRVATGDQKGTMRAGGSPRRKDARGEGKRVAAASHLNIYCLAVEFKLLSASIDLARRQCRESRFEAETLHRHAFRHSHSGDLS